MNKKFFSAVLMGALLLGGTFVSCQDYDDDIDNLQEQINKLASADQLSSKVSELQSAISAAQSAAEAKAAAAQAAADAKASKDDVKAAQAAAQEYADGLKSYADDAAAKAAQKVADQLANAATMEDVNKAIEKALEDYKALLGLAKELEELQGAIAKAATQDQLTALAERVTALEEAGIPGVAAAVASVNAPAHTVEVKRDWAVWKPTENPTKAEAARMAALMDAFDDIEGYAKGDTLEQGGKIAVLVNPSNVDLTEGYTFSLESWKGETAEATVTNPVPGLPAGTKVSKVTGVMTTKAAEDCFWTLSVAPTKGKFRQYVNLDEKHALVIENEAGVALKTPFAYTYTSGRAANVEVNITGAEAFYSDAIDVFEETESAEGEKLPALFALKNEMIGHFILSVEEPADIVKYGIKTEAGSSELKITKWPSDEDAINIRAVKVVALGLNGSTDEAIINNVKIAKTVDVANTISDIKVVLDLKKTNKARWSVAKEFADMDAAQLESVINAIKNGQANVIVSNLDNGLNAVIKTKLAAYKANGQKATPATYYGDVTDFGFDFDFNQLPPRDYDVAIQIGSLFRAKAMLTTLYPTNGLMDLRAELCDEDDVLQITGTVDVDPYVTYTLKEGFKVSTKVDATSIKFIDLDAEMDDDWVENETTLKIYKNDSVKAMYDGTEAHMYQLYTVRNFKVQFKVTGDPTVYEKEFQAEVVSPIYVEDPKETDVFDPVAGKNKVTVKENDNTYVKIMDEYIKEKKGIYAAGSMVGQKYNLVNTDNGSGAVTEGKDTTYLDVNDYDKPQTISNLTDPSSTKYIKGTNGKVIVVDDLKYIIPFGWQNQSYGYVDETHSVQLTKAMYDAGIATMNQYYYQDTIDGKVKPMKVLVWTETVEGKPVYKYDDTTHKIYHQRDYDSDASATRFIFEVDGEMMYSTNGSDTISWDNYTGPDAYDGKTVKEGWSLVNKDEAHLAFLKSNSTTATQAELYALTIDFCKEIMTKIAFNQKTLTVITDRKAADAVAASGLAKELSSVKFKWADPEKASHFADSLGEKDGKVTFKKATEIDETIDADGAKLVVNMVLTDKWGMTTIVPITVILMPK